MERRESYLAYIYESAWILPSVAIPVGMLVAIVLTTFVIGVHVPGVVDRVDPATVSITPPFDQPGVRQTGPNQYEAVVLAQIWTFSPRELRIPQGSTVSFVLTTKDVVHGFKVQGTTINVMLVPGQVTRFTYRFSEPGEFLVVCQEYCGIAHHTMAGRIVVEPAVQQ